MEIKKLKIKNFRGLNINIDDVKKISILIGQNDSGKTNICTAILKVLDYNKRRIPFSKSDSTNSNQEDIEIEITLSADDLTQEQLALVGKYIYENDTGKNITAKIVSKFNNDTLEYEDSLGYGDPDKDFFEENASRQTQLDKILAVVYINPIYNLENTKKSYFKFREKDDKEKKIYFSDNVKKELNQFNECIQEEEIIKSIESEINEKDNFDDILDGLTFKITPNIKEDNIYNTLNITTLGSNDNEYNSLGDGTNKIFSTILQSKIYDKEKKKIFIVEEPENHLYVLLQRKYISDLMKLEPSQILITTHSPYTIDLEKTRQIIKIKLSSETGDREIYNYNGISNDDFKKYGYLINLQIAEMLYYEKVLLVEGDSEKYFYSLLMGKDDEFLKKLYAKKIGICAVNGIAFKKTKELLESLGIKVYIKTDNDIFKIPHKNEYRYAGLERCIEYITEDSKNALRELLKNETLKFVMQNKDDKIEIVEENIDGICTILKNEGILFSKHNDGFEQDLIDYLKANPANEVIDEAVDFFKKAKLKNLHYFLKEYNLDIKICDGNRKNVLVDFLND